MVSNCDAGNARQRSIGRNCLQIKRQIEFGSNGIHESLRYFRLMSRQRVTKKRAKKPAGRLPHREAPGRTSPVNYRLLASATTRAATESAERWLVVGLHRWWRQLAGDVSVVRVAN